MKSTGLAEEGAGILFPAAEDRHPESRGFLGRSLMSKHQA